ncbi:MAG TPA: DUF4956 domain-containing protein [Planctomycetota bacterium]|jgi:hypothetical protein|nr:DUF4956 domain-containing protein [Planctomycetota bacterium]
MLTAAQAATQAANQVAAPDSHGFVLDRLFNLTEAGAFRLFDLLTGLLLCALLTLALVQVYRSTHRGATYSVAFLQSLFILGACTTLIMLVVGSNIARAFSLVGALSIIRFRTAIKDPRDVGFVFASLALGMGCGTGFYAAAILFTIVLSLLLLVLSRLNVGAASAREAIVRVTLAPSSNGAADSVEAALKSARAEPMLINRVTDGAAGGETISWRVRTGEAPAQGDLQERLRGIQGVSTVGVYVVDDFHVL